MNEVTPGSERDDGTPPEKWRIQIDESHHEWTRPQILGHELRLLAEIAEDLVLLYRDEELEDDVEIRLDDRDLGRVITRPGPRLVTVRYKDQDFRLERRPYTTEELMTIFPVPAGYRLDLIEASGEFRELKPGEEIPIRKGMEFTSHPPRGQAS